MESKKSSNANLEKTRSIGLLMGMAVSLSVLFVGFEWGTNVNYSMKGLMAELPAESELPPLTRRMEPPTPPPPPPAAPKVVEVLNVVDNTVKTEAPDLLGSEEDGGAQKETYKIQDTGTDEVPDNIAIVTFADEMPEFMGGNNALMSFLANSVKYPVVAQEQGLEGRVTCSFVVNTDGSIVDAQIVRGIDPSLDAEALRVINSMPKWKPGKQKGMPVRVRFTLPITFRLKK